MFTSVSIRKMVSIWFTLFFCSYLKTLKDLRLLRLPKVSADILHGYLNIIIIAAYACSIEGVFRRSGEGSQRNGTEGGARAAGHDGWRPRSGSEQK